MLNNQRGKKYRSRFPGGTYKTEFCSSWEETGHCPHGKECRFAHGANELRSRILEVKYKTEKCHYWEQDGKCPFTTRCRFLHDEKVLHKGSDHTVLFSPTEKLIRVVGSKDAAKNKVTTTNAASPKQVNSVCTWPIRSSLFEPKQGGGPYNDDKNDIPSSPPRTQHSPSAQYSDSLSNSPKRSMWQPCCSSPSTRSSVSSFGSPVSHSSLSPSPTPMYSSPPPLSPMQQSLPPQQQPLPLPLPQQQQQQQQPLPQPQPQPQQRPIVYMTTTPYPQAMPQPVSRLIQPMPQVAMIAPNNTGTSVPIQAYPILPQGNFVYVVPSAPMIYPSQVSCPMPRQTSSTSPLLSSAPSSPSPSVNSDISN